MASRMSDGSEGSDRSDSRLHPVAAEVIGSRERVDHSPPQETSALKGEASPDLPGKRPSKPDDTLNGEEGEPMCWGIPVSWISLVTLSLQTTGQALLIKWSRMRAHEGEHASQYLASTAVFFTEIVKLVASFVLLLLESGSLAMTCRSLRRNFTEQPKEVLKTVVPALIYTIQNNLMFYSLQKLSAPVQQVLYQMKIISTAGLGVVMLGRTLSKTKWSACFMLALGIAMVQWPRHQPHSEAAQSTGTADDYIEKTKGFVAVVCACLTSGFAGVFIQKMLQQTTASIWIRNFQMALFSSFMGSLVSFGKDGQAILTGGFTQGYNIRVVSVILMNALGGLLCAVMLKYAGATLGCFSTAISIILTCIFSAILLHDFVPDVVFGIGATIAVCASLLFGLGLPSWLYTISRKFS